MWSGLGSAGHSENAPGSWFRSGLRSNSLLQPYGSCGIKLASAEHSCQKCPSGAKSAPWSFGDLADMFDNEMRRVAPSCAGPSNQADNVPITVTTARIKLTP